MSSYGGIDICGWAAVAVSTLPDGGHLVYLSGYTAGTVNEVESFENLTAGNSTTDPFNVFIKVLYINPQCMYQS